MTKEITGWEKSFDKKFGVTYEKQELPTITWEFYHEVKSFIQSQIASAVEAERAKWVFASEDVRKTMTERFLQDKQNEQINPSKE